MELDRSNGLIDVGKATHELVVDGNFLQSENGTARLEITGEGESNAFNIAGSATFDGFIEVVLDTDVARCHGMRWEVLAGESLSLNGQMMHPAGLNVELLTDQFGGHDILRVWSVPEPGATTTMVVGIAVVVATFGGRQRRRAGC